MNATIINSPAVECSEIAPRLFMGSRPLPGPFLRMRGINVLVLCARDWQPPTSHFPHVEVGRCPIDDAELTPGDALLAVRMSRIVSKRIRARDNVLVTCNHGRNRSGLVTALALANLSGCSGIEAALHVKAKRRSPFGDALTNTSFVRYLMTVPKTR